MEYKLITGDASGKPNPFSRHQNLWAFVVFILLAAYALNANPFAGQTVAPFDRLLQFPGWFTTQSDRKAVHLERSDVLDSQLPTWMTLKDQIRKGESPLWYPNGAGGQPISLELCNPAFLLFLLVKSNSLAYYLVGLIKLIISGFGGYLLLKIFLRWLPSVWGGTVFMLCGFNAAWFFWEQVSTAMWIPWLLWAAVMYLKTEDKKWLPAITIISLLLIFGGFPAVAAFGFYSFTLLILVWNIYDFFGANLRGTSDSAAIFRPILNKTALPLLAVCLAFPMAAVTLLPFRAAMSGINLGYRAGGTHFEGFRDLLLFSFYETPSRVERTAYIGIPVLIFSVFGIFSTFRNTDGNLRRFILFNVFLVIVSTSIAFGLLPHGLIRTIPVFSSNSWGRLIVVPLLGFAVLSAAGLDFISIKLQELSDRYSGLRPRNTRRIIAVLLIGIIALQFHSQKTLFNKFNAVVPAEWFYPQTPSLKFVQKNLKPLQSVIADYSYWFGGTLGAYGIREWYAHSFKTERENEVLSELVHNPFSSPTSMFIDGSKIQFDSPLMDKLAIKYLLINKTALDTKHIFALPELTHDQAPPLPRNSWRQHIYIPNDMIVGAIGFSFGTYGEEHPPANVRLALYTDDGRQYSVQPELNSDEIADSRWVSFEFPNPFFMSKGGYYVVLSLPGYAGPKDLTAWSTRTEGNAGSFLEVNGVKTDFSLAWKIGYYERKDLSVFAKKWDLIDLEKNIMIFENRRVTNSAYFIKDLNPSDDRIDFSGLDVRQVSVDRIDIDYSKGDTGWIVLPVHLDPGWKAYIDGRQVKYDTYLDMLPAIPVQGASRIEFRYRSESFRRGVAVSLTGVFIFLAFSGFCFRSAGRHKDS